MPGVVAAWHSVTCISSSYLACLLMHVLLQAHLDKEDLRIELSVAALRKQSKRAAQQAAGLEVSSGEHTQHLICQVLICAAYHNQTLAQDLRQCIDTQFCLVSLTWSSL